jgi:predicted porin
MKKSLLALAVLGSFAGAAFAQSSVTVYGVMDAGISRTDNGTTTATGLDSGIQSTSRLGFRGTEDLGSGLSAIFNLESGFSIDRGAVSNVTDGITERTTAPLFGRQAWVGLNGGFGAVKLGRQETPLWKALDNIDPFGTGLAGDAGDIFGDGLYNSRSDNTINYSTGNLNLAGFSGELAYSFGETAGDSTANRQIGVGFGYANGPINVRFAYHKRNATLAAEAPLAAVNSDAKTAFLGATYDFGIAKAHVAFADNKLEEFLTGGTFKTRNYLLGVSAPVGSAGTVLASVIRNDVRNVAASDSTLWAIGYTHALSKRTNLYTSYGRIKNDANADLGGADADGLDPTRLNVGIRHRF